MDHHQCFPLHVFGRITVFFWFFFFFFFLFFFFFFWGGGGGGGGGGGRVSKTEIEIEQTKLAHPLKKKKKS